MSKSDGKTTSASSRNMKRLKDEAQVRERPAPIFGTNDEHGAFNSIKEIIANSIDEAREGFGHQIRITVEPGNVITVEDDGRGLPMHYNEEEQMHNWELALCTLYASGKYDDSQYSDALGLNGLGLTATQYASSFMDVESTYDGKTWIMHFKKGRPVGEVQTVPAKREGTGTVIKFQPDPEVFPALKTVEITAEEYLMYLREQAMLLSNLEIVFTHHDLENKQVKIVYKNGIAEFIDAICESTMLNKTVEFYDEAEGTDDEEQYPDKYKVKMRVAFNFSRNTSLVELYHNNSKMFEGGKTADGLIVGMTRAFTDVARASGRLTRGDSFLFRDIDKILVCVGTTDAPGNRTWFKNQTKGAVNNPFIGAAYSQFIYNKIRFWLESNKDAANKVMTEVIANKIAREEADKVSKKVINNLSKAVSFTNKPKDFRDCSTSNIMQRELYIVEGRSALGSVKLACDPTYQAVFPARGKPINCLKEKLSRVLNNDIVIDIYRILQCGMEARSEYITDLPKFDLMKLNWGKIILCADADVDGQHIICLFLVMFYILSPSLLKAGKVYIAQSPLYEISGKFKGKTETRFAYNEDEKAKVIDELIAFGVNEKSIKIQRSKGLGENDPEMMAISTMNPNTRRLIPVEYPQNDQNLYDMFSALLGDDLETRRLLIEEFFKDTEADV